MLAFGKIDYDKHILNLTIDSNSITTLISFDVDDCEQLCKNLLHQIYEYKKTNIETNDSNNFEAYYDIRNKLETIENL